MKASNIDVKLLNSLSPNLSFNYITIDKKGDRN